MAKPKGGLTKWFKEDWRDVKTGKKCGRSGSEKNGGPVYFGTSRKMQAGIRCAGSSWLGCVPVR